MILRITLVCFNCCLFSAILFLASFAKTQEKLKIPDPAKSVHFKNPLVLTKYDRSRLNYKIKTREEAWLNMEIYKFLYKNPKAVYFLDTYDKSRSYNKSGSRAEIEKAYNRIKSKDFFKKFMPDNASVGGELYAGVDKKINIKALGLSAGVKGKATISKSWTAEDIAKIRVERDYVQNLNGDFESKLIYHSRNLTHDIYECKREINDCLINLDSTYNYLYKSILLGRASEKKERLFPDFPAIQQHIDGKEHYLTFKEMQVQSPETAEFVDRIFTRDETTEALGEVSQKSDETLKSSKELQSNFVQYFQDQENQIQKRREQIQNNQIEQALYIVGDKSPKIKYLEKQKDTIKQGLQSLEAQHKSGQINQNQYKEQKEELEIGIADKEKEIKIAKLHSTSDDIKSWVGAGIALAQLTGAPQEVIQVGQACVAGVDIFKGLSSIAIAGLDPTGITLVVVGIATILSIFKDTGPNVDQIILDEISKIKSNQLKMLQALGRIEFGIEDIKENLKRLEDLLRKNHDEIKKEFSQIKTELFNINNRLSSSVAENRDVQQNLLMQHTKSAHISNQVAKYQDTLDERYEECHYSYQVHLSVNNLIDEKNLKETYICLDQCISNKRKNGKTDIDSCISICSPPAEAECDFNCMSKIMSQKFYLRAIYEDCQRDIDEILLKLEFNLEGTYEEANQLGDGVFILKTESLESSGGENTLELNVNDALNTKVEDRISTLSQIGGYIREAMNYISSLTKDKKKKDHDFKVELLSDYNLEKYEEVLKETAEDVLKNPLHLDENFSIYVESLNRLPLPETPIGIDGERYRYTSDQLDKMCKNVQNIEKVSKVSRANIQNIFILLQTHTGQLLNGVQSGLTKVLKSKDYKQDYSSKYKEQLKKPRKRPSAEAQKQKSMDYNEDYYEGLLSGIIKDIENNYTALELFNTTSEDIVKEVSENLSNKAIQKRGFERIVRYEDKCYQHQGQKEDLKEAEIESDTQVKMLQDTFRDVQYGDQGGCWFIDAYGLISGVAEETIRLYQMTGVDDIGYPAPEAVCSVFVTAIEGLWFLFHDWDQPTKRAICLKAEMGLLYDGDFFSGGSYHLHWLTKEEVEEGLKPRPLSAKLYMENLSDLMSIRQDLNIRESINIEKEEMEDIEYSEDGIYVMDGKSNYEKLLNYYGPMFEDYRIFMNIGILKNREEMKNQQWVNNIDRNRDSFGSCVEGSYACLKATKSVPKYGAERTKWRIKAEDEIKKFKTDIENKVKSDADTKFYEGIETIRRLRYSLDTLIKAGYGSKQLENKNQLKDLDWFLENVNEKVNILLLKLNTTDFFYSHIQSIEELDTFLKIAVDRIQQDQLSEEGPLIPNVSAKEYGFGFPQKRAEALKSIRSDFQTDQCRYQERIL